MTEVESKTEVPEDQKPAEVVEATEEKDVEEQEDKKAEEKDDIKTTAEPKKERRGIVSDASVLPESDNPKEIVKQIEFYFADSNLRYDKFLWGLVGEENKWVDIALVAGFNRMRRFKSLEKIKTALEDSSVMEMNEDKTKMRRKHPMTIVNDPRTVDKAIQRSVYAKGFGIETKTSQFDIEKFFEGAEIPINAVRLRRDDSKVFKGSVFVEFGTIEDMNKFMELKDKPKWNGKEMKVLEADVPETQGSEESSELKENLSTSEKAAQESENGIQYMTKEAFVEMKLQAIKDGKMKPKYYDQTKKQKFDAFKASKHGKPQSRNGGGGGGRGGRGGKHNNRDNNRRGRRDGGRDRDRSRSRSKSPRRDDRDWRERREDDRKGGFKDRRSGRDSRRGRSRSPPKHSNGVPKVRTASPSETKGTKPAIKMIINDDDEKKPVKRSRDETEADHRDDRGESPVKKSKTAAIAEAA